MDREGIPARCHVRAWAPGVPGIREVFHAHMVEYAYPAHCHDTWAILIVDDGAISYDLDHRERFAAGQTVTVLPPGVPHDGGPAPGATGFRKREFYLDETLLPATLAGAAVDRAGLSDGALRTALARLHDQLRIDGPDLALGAEAGISLIAERITGHLAGLPRKTAPPSGAVARRLREFLDARFRDDVRLADAATLLDRSVPHLVRSFTREFGLSPYAYVLGRRIDAARGLLLAEMRPAEVAHAVGFYDQAHFTRHFKRYTSVTPAAYARSHRATAR